MKKKAPPTENKEKSPQNPHPKKVAMISALEAALGIVTMACKTVGIDRNTHYNWYNDDADYRAKVDAIQGIVLDFSESQLHKQIKEGNTAATIFHLKTKGKKRGYVEKDETTQTVTINLSSLTTDDLVKFISTTNDQHEN
jgi:hypothetical protein